MTSPLILVNLKTYKEGMGNRAHQIATAAQLVARESGAVIGIAPGYIDLHPLCHHFTIPVYAQHVDGYEPGPRPAMSRSIRSDWPGRRGRLSTIPRGA